jgi:hypothetical protein
VVRLSAVAAVLAVVIAACASASPASPGLLDLHIENGLTSAVTVVVDGAVVGVVPAGQSVTFPTGRLPGGGWTVEARLPGGTSVVSFPVTPGAVTRTTDPNGHTSASGVGERADLSCGRLDVWVGAPMLGPAPLPGSPGDCDG